MSAPSLVPATPASLDAAIHSLNGYICFYLRQRVEVYAKTTYAAQCEAAKILHVPAKRQYLISVVLAEKVICLPGEQPRHVQVTHTADF